MMVDALNKPGKALIYDPVTEMVEKVTLPTRLENATVIQVGYDLYALIETQKKFLKLQLDTDNYKLADNSDSKWRFEVVQKSCPTMPKSRASLARVKDAYIYLIGGVA